MLRNLLVILLLVIMTAACKPRPFGMAYAPSDAPPMYQDGWEDGCSSGLAAYGNDVYKAFYSYKQDVQKIKDRTYYKAWIDSFNYCRAYVNRYLIDGYWSQDGFEEGDMRSRKVMEGASLGIGSNPLNTPGYYGEGPFSTGFQGLNRNLTGSFFSTDESDWLGREGSTDWLGRTSESSPGEFGL